MIDQLTGLYTKRHFTAELARVAARCRRTDEPLSLVLCDIDRFKDINDAHGHVTGDLVLAEVGAALRAALRRYDTAFRYGGEELCILAPQTALPSALQLAERLRGAVAALEVDGPAAEPLRVTASFGVAAFDVDHAAPQDLVAAADRALYRAKAEGRNRVAAARSPARTRRRDGAGTPPRQAPPSPRRGGSRREAARR